jgi:Protein of unknown function (DUF2985)
MLEIQKGDEGIRAICQET